MEEVVSQPAVSHARLLGDRFQRRMRIYQRHSSQKAAVRNSRRAHASVVLGHIFHQPLNRVVRVRALVHALGVAGVMQRPVHHKLPLGAISPANILKHEHVSVRKHVRIPVKFWAVSLIGCGNPVRRALQKNRQRLLGLFRRVNLRVQFHAVPHRNHHFLLLKQGWQFRPRRPLPPNSWGDNPYKRQNPQGIPKSLHLSQCPLNNERNPASIP